MLMVVAAAAAQPIIQITDSPAGIPAGTHVVMGSSQVVVGQYVAAATGTEGVRLVTLSVQDGTSSAVPCFVNLRARVGATVVTSPGVPFPGPNGGFAYTLSFTAPLTVNQGQTTTVTLVADVVPFAVARECDGSVNRFAIADSGVVAIGTSSNTAAIVHALAHGTDIRLLRSDLTVSATPGSDLHAFSALRFTANPQGFVFLNQVTVTANNIPMANRTSLYDRNGNEVTLVGEAIRIQNGNQVTWHFTNPGYAIPAGAIATFTARDSGLPTSGWFLRIVGAADVVFTDGVNGIAANPSPGPFPLTVH